MLYLFPPPIQSAILGSSTKLDTPNDSERRTSPNNSANESTPAPQANSDGDNEQTSFSSQSSQVGGNRDDPKIDSDANTEEDNIFKFIVQEKLKKTTKPIAINGKAIRQLQAGLLVVVFGQLLLR